MKKAEESNEKSPCDIPQGSCPVTHMEAGETPDVTHVTSAVFQEFKFQNSLFPNLFHLPS